MGTIISRIRYFAAGTLCFVVVGAPADGWAQRYLTEFVGSSRITKSTGLAQNRPRAAAAEDPATAPTLFNITEIGSTRNKANALPFAGTFTLNITDGTSNITTRKFSHKGSLFSNGDCTANLKRPGTSGELDLVETSFDGERKVFALVGTIAVDPNDSDPAIPNGLSGSSVFLRPALTQIRIPLGSRALTLVSADTSIEISTTLELDSKRRHNVRAGTFVHSTSNETFFVIASASRKWLYLAGVSESRYFTAKIPVTRNGDVFREGAGGTYRIVNGENQLLDSGAVSVGALSEGN